MKVKDLIVWLCQNASLEDVVVIPSASRERIDQLNREKEMAVSVQDFDKAASLREQADRLKSHKQWLAFEPARITPGSIALVVELRDQP